MDQVSTALHGFVPDRPLPRVHPMSSGRIFLFVVAAFFTAMLVVPTSFVLERGAVLAVLMLGAGAAAANGQWRVRTDMLLVYILTMAFGTFGVTLGFVHGAPGALRVITVYIVWPTIYLFFIGLVHNPKVIHVLSKAILIGIWVSAGLAILLFVSATTGHMSQFQTMFAFAEPNVGLYSGYSRLTLLNLTTVLYGFPFLATMFVLKQTNGEQRNKLNIGALLLLVVVVFAVSGRRASWVLVAATPIMILGLCKVCRVPIRARSIVLISVFIFSAGVIGLLYLGLDLSGLVDRLSMGFQFHAGGGGSLREAQFKALVSGWASHPIFGTGFGSAAKSIIRSEQQPWAYELFYVALLFHSGLLGFFVYASAVLWIFWRGIKVVRSDRSAAPIILPLLVGCAGFLMINAADPYLGKFDYLWTLFLPVAAINAYRTRRS